MLDRSATTSFLPGAGTITERMALAVSSITAHTPAMMPAESTTPRRTPKAALVAASARLAGPGLPVSASPASAKPNSSSVSNILAPARRSWYRFP